MTFIIKTRGARGLMVAEYLCPVHGRFDAMVQREDNGDPPDVAECPWFDEYEDKSVALCLRASPFAMSAPHGRVKLAEVYRGKSDPHLPHQLDTRPLAEGMPYDEWAKKVDKKARDERIKHIRSKV